MAAIRGNTPKRRKLSMAEELMTLVNEEEYSDSVQAMTDDEYITKTEMTSIKKMICGKLWVDSRKFSNRQNQCIATGMYKLFGSAVSKSANDVHAELCQYFLEPDSKPLRDILRESMKNSKISYSNWITDFNNITKPCDEFGVYLLCRCYKRHVGIITSKRLLCSFKPGNMSTFEKLCKCDNVLLWLGESRFAEVKPLQTSKGVGPLQEWQLASDCVNHIHEKNLSAKRPRKPISKRSTDIAQTVSPRGTKRKRGEIDYKQYHTDGTLAVRSPPTTNRDKPLPRASGPSKSRLASQEYIRRSNSKQSILGVATKTEVIKKEFVPSNRVTRISHKLVKEEPNIRLVHRKEKLMGPECVIHASGKLCKSSNKGGYFDDELPDLPSVPEHISDSRVVQTLHSPPIAQSTKQLVLDVLSGYKIDNTSRMTTPRKPTQVKPQSRAMQTPRVVQTVSDVLSGYVPNVPIKLPVTSMQPPEVSRVVATQETDTELLATTSNLEDMVTTEDNMALSKTESRSVPTAQKDSVSNETQLFEYNESRVGTTYLDDDDFEQAERTAAADRNTELHLLLDDEQCDSRVVATDTDLIKRNQTDIEAAETLLQLRDTDTADTSQDEEATTEPPKHKDTATDVPAKNDDETPVEHHNQEIDILDENEVLMPVDAPMQQDFVKDMAEVEKAANPKANADNDDDDAETIIYEPDTPKTHS